MADGSLCAVVIATRNRAERLVGTVQRIRALPERPQVLVADNASTDGTAGIVANAFPDVELISLSTNQGAAARNVGVYAATAPYVAFSDDDSWWAPGSLARAAGAFDSHPELGVVAARILVGPDERLDPVSATMARSPLRASDGLPGRPVMGFVACGAVVRRTAFLEAGGFHPRYGMGSEEDLIAIDMAAKGWKLAYLPDVVAHHHPDPGPRPGRWRQQLRNSLWTTWLRRPAGPATRRTLAVLRAAGTDPAAWRAIVDAAVGLPWVIRERRAVPAGVERMLRTLGR